MLKAFPAIDRTALRGFERNSCFPLAARADGLGFNTLVVASTLRQPEGLGTFGFAAFAPFGFVLKLFIVEKQLLASSEDEVGAAIDTLENLVLELHFERCPFLLHPNDPPDGTCFLPDRGELYHRFGPRGFPRLQLRFPSFVTQLHL